MIRQYEEEQEAALRESQQVLTNMSDSFTWDLFCNFRNFSNYNRFSTSAKLTKKHRWSDKTLQQQEKEELPRAGSTSWGRPARKDLPRSSPRSREWWTKGEPGGSADPELQGRGEGESPRRLGGRKWLRQVVGLSSPWVGGSGALAVFKTWNRRLRTAWGPSLTRPPTQLRTWSTGITNTFAFAHIGCNQIAM